MFKITLSTTKSAGQKYQHVYTVYVDNNIVASGGIPCSMYGDLDRVREEIMREIFWTLSKDQIEVNLDEAEIIDNLY